MNDNYTTTVAEVLAVYDLHSHSNCSDGILPPEALVSRAKDKGVKHLALTDHDTTQGIKAALTAAQVHDIELIAGIELSCLWNGVGIHVLGLNIDIDHVAMLEAVQVQHDNRRLRSDKIAERLAKKGIVNSLEGARKIAGDGVLGRPHFAAYMIEAGYVKNHEEAFKRYLGAGKIGDVKQMWPSIEQAVSWIVSAGGVAVLAHPDKYGLTRSKLKRLLDDFTEAGGQAMELVSGLQTKQLTGNLLPLIKEYDLHASCGSDFHAPGRHWQELGVCGYLAKDIPPVWALWQGAEQTA